jgi:hypothetical protein
MPAPQSSGAATKIDWPPMNANNADEANSKGSALFGVYRRPVNGLRKISAGGSETMLLQYLGSHVLEEPWWRRRFRLRSGRVRRLVQQAAKGEWQRGFRAWTP